MQLYFGISRFFSVFSVHYEFMLYIHGLQVHPHIATLLTKTP